MSFTATKQIIDGLAEKYEFGRDMRERRAAFEALKAHALAAVEHVRLQDAAIKRLMQERAADVVEERSEVVSMPFFSSSTTSRKRARG